MGCHILNYQSRILDEQTLRCIESAVKGIVEREGGVLSTTTSASTRAVGDAIQSVVSHGFESVLGDRVTEFVADLPRRSMADFAFTDDYGTRHLVDVKTHRVDTSFNMPNLTSVKRLIDLYEETDVFFMVLMIRYQVEDSNIRVVSVDLTPIEWIEWGCLTIGALGWGQIQIANSEHFDVNPRQSRQHWMTQLCNALLTFYPGEIAKIRGRIEFAEQARERWEGRLQG